MESRMPSALTDLEQKILDYMVFYLRSNTYQPSIREIGEEFGIKSTKTVSEHLQALAEKGYLERDPSRSRGIRILGMDLDPQTISVPCFREIPDDRDTVPASRAETHFSMDRRIAGAKGSFFVRARGDEMLGLGLSEGDFLLVEPARADQIADGDVVAARNGEHRAFFRLSRDGSSVLLRPSLPDAPPIPVEDMNGTILLGRVTALYRRMNGVGAVMSTTAH
jgi:repressor LexA